MKKKLSSLLLVIAMLAGMSSCGSGSAGTETTSSADYNMTLTLWLPTSESTTEESVKMVEDAINEITRKNYNTAIDITAIPEDEYDEAIKEKVLAVEEAEKLSKEEAAARKKAEREAKKRGETLAPLDTETAEAETIINENGEVEEKYPSVGSNQLDIFCIRGYDNFLFYADNGHLSPLEESLNASAKLLKATVYPSFINGTVPLGETSPYAIPNNHTIGDYTYLLINKEYCDKLNYHKKEFTSLLSCQEFIEDIGASKDKDDIIPLREFYFDPTVEFWNSNMDKGQFSLFGSFIHEGNPTDKEDDIDIDTVGISNVLGANSFTDTWKMMKELQEKGYVGENPDEDDKFGVGVISCDASEIAKYEDEYYVNVIKQPRATTEDIYQSMFAVSTYTLDVTRSMEIITAINTDTTIRTILQYGVQGVHWDYNDKLTNNEKTIKFLDKHNEYLMNIVDTGNTFFTYPDENVPMSFWDYGRQQNLDSLDSPFLRFTNIIDDQNADSFADYDALSAEFFERIDAMSAEEFAESKDTLKKEFDDDPLFWEINNPDEPVTLTGRFKIFKDDVIANTKDFVG